MASTDTEISRVFREVRATAIATLVRVFGDIDLAEDAVQDAFAVAIDRWAEEGIPANPAGWIITTARRRAIDLARRRSRGSELEQMASATEGIDGWPQGEGLADRGPADEIGDDRLRLFFTCCHPSLRPEHQVALTLRLIGGLSIGQIADAFLVSETAMARRIGRAKYKISAARIPYRIPSGEQLPARLRPVLAVVYLVYNAGTADIDSGRPLRVEATRLARILVDLLPDEPETLGLLALLLLNESRMDARSAADGPVLLRDQDRTEWNRVMIVEGHRLVRDCVNRGRPGPYQLQAAIQAVHCHASTFAETDWPQIVSLYDHLLEFTPTAVVRLNRAIAVGETDGPAVGLRAVDDLADQLSTYHLWHAARATMLRDSGRRAEARAAFERAAELVASDIDRVFYANQARLC